ncbi:hypothetical protein QYF36_007241 [Acer negundo]|nr:hypothetical protein QYF36_007241 [Acer negundo]
MDYDDLSKLCETLSFSDDDIPETKIKGEFKRVSDRKVAHSLVGKDVRKGGEIDLGYSRDFLDKFLLVRVIIDISKPFKRALKVGVEDSDEMATILVRYERLPDLCFHCGILGHPLRECPLQKSMEDVGRTLKYGSWIRAGAILGEELRGKRPRGDVDQHGGRARQGLLEPKPISRRIQKAVSPLRMSEKRGSPILEFDMDHRSSTKKRGKPKFLLGKDLMLLILGWRLCQIK